jgi:sodium transport system ATP-binding protein
VVGLPLEAFPAEAVLEWLLREGKDAVPSAAVEWNGLAGSGGRNQVSLRALELTRIYGETSVVAGVNLELRPGEVLGLLGPNGAGKTTILRMLAGILTPSAGQVLLDGRDVHAHPLEARRRIGFLSGDTQLYQRLTPLEVLRFFGQLFEIEPRRLSARIDQLQEELDLKAFATRSCGTLSSGQKQRVNIARAFLHEPDILILDEPTNALDLISGRFIVESIRRQRSEGRAILFSTHIMGEAEYLCDRIAMLYQGKIHDTGTLPELLGRSSTTNLTDAFLHYIPEIR